MEIEKIEGASKLYSRYKKSLSNIRKVLEVSDPKFRPITAEMSDDGKELRIFSESGSEVIKTKLHGYFSFSEYSKSAEINDLKLGLTWINNEIDKLNELQRQIDEL